MAFLTTDQVAARIGFDSSAQFLRHRTRLEDDHDFPTPMPTCLRPLKWRADAVEAWLMMQGEAKSQGGHLAALAAASPNVVLLAEARRA